MKVCSLCRQCYEDTEQICARGDGGTLVPARAGTRLVADKYRLDRLLGRGGMGAVYAVTHVELDRPAAVKLLLPDLVADSQALERFRREARAAARLNHPNVADTYDYGLLPGGEAYIVMELVIGQTLREYINTSGLLPVREAVAIMRQVADGVEAAHQNGIIHRDLKPSNIILTRDHLDAVLAKVVDFGIAKLKEATTSAGVLTSTGSLVGTPRYMSPEQCAGQDLDARSDIYSLGIILYETLAGRTPFDAPSATAIALKHLQEPPPSLAEFRRDVPAPLSLLVMQTLAKDVGGRPASAADLARALRQIEHTETGAATAVAADNYRRHDGAQNALSSDPAHPPAPPLHVAPLDREQPPPRPTPASDAASPLTTGATFTSHTNSHEAANSPATNRAGAPTLSTSGSRPTDSSPRADEPPLPVATAAGAQAETVTHVAAVRPPAPHVAGITLPVTPAPFHPAHTGGESAPPAKRLPARALYLVLPLAALIVLGIFWLSRFRQTPPPLANERAATTTTSTSTTTAVPVRDRRPSGDAPATAGTAATQAQNGIDADADGRALRAALDGWVAAINDRDTERQLDFYMPRLAAFYLTRNVSRDFVRREKEATFAQASAVQVRVGAPQITFNSADRTARMLFHKEYNINRGGSVRRGAVLQEIVWQKSDQEWKIISERDLQELR